MEGRAALLLALVLMSGLFATSRGASRNMGHACYTNPTASGCAAYMRADADWSDDMTQFCSAAPFALPCTMWRQCQASQASGRFCTPPSLAASACSDRPATAGCEAWRALCKAGSVVAQCKSPGPLPNLVPTDLIKEGIDSLCYTHCMDGCSECYCHGRQGYASYAFCTDPGAIFALQCYQMPGMPECREAPTGTGWSTMCSNAEVKAAFPKLCTLPTRPPLVECPDNYDTQCEAPAPPGPVLKSPPPPSPVRRPPPPARRPPPPPPAQVPAPRRMQRRPARTPALSVALDASALL